MLLLFLLAMTSHSASQRRKEAKRQSLHARYVFAPHSYVYTRTHCLRSAATGSCPLPSLPRSSKPIRSSFCECDSLVFAVVHCVVFSVSFSFSTTLSINVDVHVHTEYRVIFSLLSVPHKSNYCTFLLYCTDAMQSVLAAVTLAEYRGVSTFCCLLRSQNGLAQSLDRRRVPSESRHHPSAQVVTVRPPLFAFAR